jgi:hypothetical protein
MKILLMGVAVIIIAVFCLVTNTKMELLKRNYNYLEVVATEASCSGAMFLVSSEFSQGRLVFNQTECNKAVDYQIKSMLHLDDSYNTNLYWIDQIQYEVLYFDDSNTVFPVQYSDPEVNIVKTIGDPTVIVKINAGDSPDIISGLIPGLSNCIRVGAHEFETR